MEAVCAKNDSTVGSAPCYPLRLAVIGVRGVAGHEIQTIELGAITEVSNALQKAPRCVYGASHRRDLALNQARLRRMKERDCDIGVTLTNVRPLVGDAQLQVHLGTLRPKCREQRDNEVSDNQLSAAYDD